jgi:hypothetical protein
MFLAALSLGAWAGARHPCTPAADLGPDRYARRSMVVFPLEVADPDAIVVEGTWSGAAPDGAPLRDVAALLRSTASGLFSTDWPLPRFDAWHTVEAPKVDGDTAELAQRGQALACADAAVIPRLTAAEVDVETARVRLTLGLDVYQRDAEGRLVRTDALTAAAPGLVDSVEDMMTAARQSSVDKLRDALPVKQRAVDGAEIAANVVLDLLPEDQAGALEDVAKQTALAATRVASVARPAVLIPMLESGEANPGALGLQWRGEEERCYLKPPKDEEPERRLVCAALSRSRQAVRSLQLATRRIEAFRLVGPLAKAYNRPATPIGEVEGVKVGDGYFVRTSSGRVGYARVRRVGSGGAEGSIFPSRLQVVYGPQSGAEPLSVREHPQLGIEIGLTGGILPGARPQAALPADPIGGGARQVGAGGTVMGGNLRFDVNLGRTAKLYEWYQTNRIVRGFAGSLRHGSATFGLERRLQVAPRTSLLAGVGVTVGSWSVPSGVTKYDDPEDELRASASHLGGDLEAGLSFLVTPNLVVRASGVGRVSKTVRSFEWSDDDLSGEVVPLTADGSPFRLRTSGVGALVTTAWVF